MTASLADAMPVTTRDELTGLHNRRYLLTAIERELRIARLHDSDLCLLLMDVDHFKSVNDTFGHGIGDALLTATARTLTDGIRDTDTLARYGGEEFVALLP